MTKSIFCDHVVKKSETDINFIRNELSPCTDVNWIQNNALKKIINKHHEEEIDRVKEKERRQIAMEIKNLK